jgi:hypothetical protein
MSDAKRFEDFVHMYKSNTIKNLMNWPNLFVIQFIVKHTNTNRIIIWKASRFTRVNVPKFKR